MSLRTVAVIEYSEDTVAVIEYSEGLNEIAFEPVTGLFVFKIQLYAREASLGVTSSVLT